LLVVPFHTARGWLPPGQSTVSWRVEVPGGSRSQPRPAPGAGPQPSGPTRISGAYAGLVGSRISFDGSPCGSHEIRLRPAFFEPVNVRTVFPSASSMRILTSLFGAAFK